MKRHPTLFLRGLAATLALCSATAWAGGSVKAAYVESTVPSRPYAGNLQFLNTPVSGGPGAVAGVLAISSLTLTNYDTSAQQVFIFVPVLAAGAVCGSAVLGGANPTLQVYVPAQSTLHLPFPTPLIINPLAGQLCLAAEVTTTLHGGSVGLSMVGYIN